MSHLRRGLCCSRCGSDHWTVRGHRMCLDCRVDALDDLRWKRALLVSLVAIFVAAVVIGVLAASGCAPSPRPPFRADVLLSEAASVASTCGPGDGQHCGCEATACQRPCSSCCASVPCERPDGPPTCAR